MPQRKMSPVLRWFGEWMQHFYVPVYRDMAIYLAVLLACGFYSIYFPRYEKFLPLLRVLLSLLFGATAVWLGFCNGFWKKISFPIMASATAVVPGILYWIAHGYSEVQGFRGFLYDLSSLLFKMPFEMTRRMIYKMFFLIPVPVAAFLPVISVWLFFAAGWIMRNYFFPSSKH